MINTAVCTVERTVDCAFVCTFVCIRSSVRPSARSTVGSSVRSSARLPVSNYQSFCNVCRMSCVHRGRPTESSQRPPESDRRPSERPSGRFRFTSEASYWPMAFPLRFYTVRDSSRPVRGQFAPQFAAQFAGAVLREISLQNALGEHFENREV